MPDAAGSHLLTTGSGGGSTDSKSAAHERWEQRSEVKADYTVVAIKHDFQAKEWLKSTIK